ncbi:Phytoene dehydrogenase-related protein [Streptomyces sp. DvalAA-14]|uniref:phytoene desaturase family protein n=1 Tax=unclassified Streptomyces TaxID=2593676 RepID=UPI00081BC085|nr:MULTISPECIES: NAD(P)/FAD-dependent oxidoreductase [unclassified Streptomyces]MYS24241.1 NAD(P)-binding protein [Streptomyces sp. SID4948]SCE44123.1 Phytoene dehydrogenase-related protein [Streptomyces sp. DvalAA-14]
MNDFPARADVVFVGAGHNALVAAAYLLEAGRSVCLLERMDQPGGWVRTSELGAPGFRHDPWSALHPFFVGGPVWPELGPHLNRHGLEYVVGPLSIGASLPDGRSGVVPVDPVSFAEELDRLGEATAWNSLFTTLDPYLEPLFGLLGSGLDSPEAEARLASLLLDSRSMALPFGQLLSGTAMDLVTGCFRSEELRLTAAPWPLHLGVGPEDAPGALWTVLSLAVLSGGNPTPVGGSGRLADALAALVAERGGATFCDVDVDEILVRDGHGAGVRTSGGAVIEADEAVVVSATPDQLYGRLLRDTDCVPAGVRAQARGYRYRRGCFQLNLALSARPRFHDSRLDAGGSINLGRGVDALVTSVRQAHAGLLPRCPSIAWHEPTAVDPTRAPAGKAVVRLQVLDVPLVPIGDAAGTSYGADGWDAATAEAFADRVLAEAESHVPGLTGLVLERHITTPADLARQNPNAGPGDHAAGENSLAQGLLQRPIPAHAGGYRTAVPGVWLIGAATWPGAGVGGVSGRAVAKALLG